MNALEHYQSYLKRRHYSEQTVIHYISDLSLFQRCIGDKPWELVEKKDILSFIQQQQKQQFRDRTINRRLHAIKGFYRYLIEDLDYCLKSPVTPSHFIRTGRPLPQTLSEQQVDQFFSVITDIRDQAIFHLMLRCGLRVGEVATLQIGNVDLFNRQLRFFGKGNRERVVPFSEMMFELLKKCCQQRPKTAPLFFWNKKFPQKPLQINSIQYLLKRYSQKAKVDLHTHLFRHTFARQMTENGVERTVLRDLMGHASIESTDAYGKLSDPFIKESYFKAMELIEEENSFLSPQKVKNL